MATVKCSVTGAFDYFIRGQRAFRNFDYLYFYINFLKFKNYLLKFFTFNLLQILAPSLFPICQKSFRRLLVCFKIMIKWVCNKELESLKLYLFFFFFSVNKYRSFWGIGFLTFLAILNVLYITRDIFKLNFDIWILWWVNLSGTFCLIQCRFTKVDLYTPASRKGLPITLVICRMALQDILVSAVGPNILRNKSKVVDFMQEANKVWDSLQIGTPCTTHLCTNRTSWYCKTLHRLDLEFDCDTYQVLTIETVWASLLDLDQFASR